MKKEFRMQSQCTRINRNLRDAELRLAALHLVIEMRTSTMDLPDLFLQAEEVYAFAVKPLSVGSLSGNSQLPLART